MTILKGKVTITSSAAYFVGNDNYKTRDNRFTIHLEGGCHYSITTDIDAELVPSTFWLHGGPLDGCYT